MCIDNIIIENINISLFIITLKHLGAQKVGRKVHCKNVQNIFSQQCQKGIIKLIYVYREYWNTWIQF